MINTITIAMIQINTIVGDLHRNASKMLDYYQRAIDLQADLAIFPECALSGYPPADLVFNKNFIKAIENEVETLRQRISYKCAMIFGTPLQSQDKIYNSMMLLEKNKKPVIRHKKFLPNFGVFDEKRNFNSSRKQTCIKFREISLGVAICEDMRAEQTVKTFQKQNADALVFINASPYESDKKKYRQNLAASICTKIQKPLLYINKVGGQDELIFDGFSFAMNQKAELIGELDGFKEDIAVVKITKNEQKDIKINFKKPDSHTDKSELTHLQMDYLALVIGLRDYVSNNGFESVLLGLSGGIDSALCATLAVDAFGKDKVSAVMMPFEFTSKQSMEHATDTASKLEIAYHIIPINPVVKACEDALAAFLEDKKPDTTEENIQSRIRGLLLMAISNKTRALLLTTGNKSEVAVGYATLYGDMNGSFNPIKDVYKTKVFELAKLRNSWFHPLLFGKPGICIEQDIIDKPPSAELRHNQLDRDSLPDYQTLDTILQSFIESQNKTNDKIKKQYGNQLVAEIYNKLMSAEYKRTQAALGTKISRLGFGRDWRHPDTNFFRYNK